METGSVSVTVVAIAEQTDIPVIPNFEILGRIGGGAYGEVYIARTVTGSFRAVKVVRREDFELERTFEREFEGIQRYEQVSQNHPGLVAVLHVGREDDQGFYYYVMELADDQNGDRESINAETYEPRTLASDLRRNRSNSVSDCVRLGVLLSEALGHLHSAGLTHRDVKPSNIIFVKGKPKLADVGLVAQSGQRTYVGTEGYVPPEGPGTASADLYSLAMVLYEMHTGKDRLDFPELPTNLEIPPTVNRDEWRALNSAICRAGSPDPRKRYETAHAFSAALRRVSGEEVRTSAAHTGSPVGRIAWTLLVLAILGVAGVGGYWLWKDREQFLAKNTPPPEEKKKEDPMDPTKKGDPIHVEQVREVDGKKDGDTGLVLIPPPEKQKELVFSDPPTEKPAEKKKEEPEKTKETVKEKSEKSSESEKQKKIQATVVTPSKVELKIFSSPSGATVWQGDKEVGRTPTSFLEFDPGEVHLVIKRPGYHDYELTVEEKEGSHTRQVDLLPDFRPVNGQPWVNSLGLDFVQNLSGEWVTDFPLKIPPLKQFKEATGQEVPLNEFNGAVQVPSNELRWNFADWLTKLDRDSGYLDGEWYHRPLRGASESQSDNLYLRLDNRFGTLVLNSQPEGAAVYQGSKFVDYTPLQIDRIRFGPVQFSLHMGGFGTKQIIVEVTSAEVTPVVVDLERDNSAIFGQAWTNSLGMTMVPIGDTMVSSHETRVMDYQAFLAESDTPIAVPFPGYVQGPDHPIAGIGLEDANAFCEWLTTSERSLRLIEPWQKYRLPTDKEWSGFAGLAKEKGDTPADRDRNGSHGFPWGKEWIPPANAANLADESATGVLGRYVIEGYNDGYVHTSPVRAFTPTTNGLYDLSGNVWEWVSDPYDRTGSSLGVLRGGAWNSYDRNVLSASYRNAVPAASREAVFGFRIMLVNEP